MEKLLKKLYSYNSKGIKLGLDNIKNIMDKLGNPQKKYKTIHIAGTNGKGSTASIIETVLGEAGFHVGKYTSPHLVKFNERIVVNKNMITDEEVAFYFEKVEKSILDLKIEATFFEITTAMMFLYFADKNVEWAVIETGMGGRYDSTNIVMPEISVITNISLDHTEYLGDTIRKIAFEKAGIIKKDIPVFFCDDKKDTIEVIKEHTDKYFDVLNIYINSDYYLDKEKFYTIINVEDWTYELSLFGTYQSKNFLTAYSVLRYIGIEKEIIQKGVQKVNWEGRFEVKRDKIIKIYDGAHNSDSALKLKENIEKIYKKDEIVLLCSILKDKDVKEILKIFAEFTDTVLFTSLKHYNRGLDSIELKNIGGEFFKIVYCEDDLINAIKKVENLNKKAIIFAGSLYLIGELKKVEKNG